MSVVPDGIGPAGWRPGLPGHSSGGRDPGRLFWGLVSDKLLEGKRMPVLAVVGCFPLPVPGDVRPGGDWAGPLLSAFVFLLWGDHRGLEWSVQRPAHRNRGRSTWPPGWG